jgi:biopolymer transport protein ExbB
MDGLDFGVMVRGGPVMWVLLVLSVGGLVIFCERVLFLHRGQIRAADFLVGIKNSLAKRRLLEAITVCEETPGPVATVVKAALVNHDAGPERLRFAVQEAALVEIPALERRISALAAVARVAPLLGLLGTVLGLMRTFLAFNAGGQYATAGALSGGMWEALLTTAGGLAIAVPAHLGYHFLSSRVRALVHDMEWVANEIMRYVLHDLPKVAAANNDRETEAETVR